MDLRERDWWNYLEHDLQELISLSFYLEDRIASWEEKFHDYAFIVFPAAKAYEGFLKKIFLDLGLIDEGDYFGKHFRIGKALNPNLEKKYRNNSWVYGKLVDMLEGHE